MKLTTHTLALALTFAMTAAAGSAQAASVSWNIDKMHSEVGFSVRHLGITKVTGKFKDFDAKVSAGAKDGALTRIEATAKTASVDTDNTKRDNHLKSDDFFNAEKFPTLKLVTKKITWSGNKFEAIADFTMRDVTKTVVFRGERLGVQKVNFGGGDQLRAGYEAIATINRQEFGLRFNKIAEGVSVVSDNVDIIFNVQISRKL